MQPRQTAHVVTVTRDYPDGARDYADRHGWIVEILSVPPLRGTIEHRLVSRTPWVFLFDASGVLRYEGNGARMDVIAEFISTGSGTEIAP